MSILVVVYERDRKRQKKKKSNASESILVRETKSYRVNEVNHRRANYDIKGSVMTRTKCARLVNVV